MTELDEVIPETNRVLFPGTYDRVTQLLSFPPGETTRRDDAIVQNQMFAQANRGHRTDPSAQRGGTTHHHPEGPTEFFMRGDGGRHDLYNNFTILSNIASSIIQCKCYGLESKFVICV